MKTTDLTMEQLADMIVNNALAEGNITPIRERENNETEDFYEDRLYTEALDIANSAIARIEKNGIFTDTDDDEGEPAWYDEARDLTLPRIMRMLEGSIAYVVIEDTANDFETEVRIVGAYHTREKARKKLASLADEERENWENDEITVDTPDRFEAFRDERWAQDHAAYGIHPCEMVEITGDSEKDEAAIIAAACKHADFSDIADNVTEIEENTEMPYGTHYEDN